MLILLLCIEGALLTIVSSSSNIIHTDEVEQLHPMTFEKYGGSSTANISKRSIMNFRKFSSYFQGRDSACKSCGLVNSNQRNFLIFNGVVVKPPYKYPWMVRVQSKKEMGIGNCGGSIINEYYIMTAAHCVVKKNVVYDPKVVTVHFLTDTYKLTSGSKVQAIIPHPEYKSNKSLKHDIALLKLQKKIICDMYKRPICLPPPNLKIPQDTEVKIAGWGKTETGEPIAERKLREGSMKLVNFRKCTNLMSVQSLQGTAYCYEEFEHLKQKTGSGDSGSPSFYERDGKYYAIGVNAGGISSHKIFISVPNHLNWIKQVTKSSF